MASCHFKVKPVAFCSCDHSDLRFVLQVSLVNVAEFFPYELSVLSTDSSVLLNDWSRVFANEDEEVGSDFKIKHFRRLKSVLRTLHMRLYYWLKLI